MMIFYVVAGGFCGAILRYWVSEWLKPFNPKGSFPWVILSINVMGSFLFGVLQSIPFSSEMALFLMTGMLGSFTTFSTFGVEAAQLLMGKQLGRMISYISLSLLGSILAFWIGFSL